ncbi:MAG: autoinducer binding domain-containing protein [Rhizobacter sp.]|nr:autoinducer binding domain-containing protein [Rhizobacter sp.]
MLHRDYVSVLGVEDSGEFQSEMVRLANRLGFNTVSVTLVVDRAADEPEFFSVHNTPAGYMSQFMDRANGRTNPVAQHCKGSGLPLAWDQSTYVEAGQAHLWDQQAKYGYRCGIATALHLPGGLHVMVGVDRDQSLPGCPAMLGRTLSDLHLLAAYAQEVAVRLLLPVRAADGRPSLTKRELECLKWTMEGKTAWEIGRILGLSENTVVRHAHNAARKLGCSSKHHAVVKALRMGLID